ncbi:NAD-dependent epimerase/dehydratase family protein [Candidatus Woesearchaeota archaeon]|nr:NAD-dependent epimerase/dehydratase family protein [Nanoarchaeota archaeon]MCB9370341.1 NAD-dependent epimerase/dehydratase family protein [Candidatus Woesearchaeota archaeon]USN44862.1 MAG: NAD-dependent epimerase/dehydratase family protein [Candidatus Woesearchaeota archaeon]
MAKYIVTGSAGFIGFHLCLRLLKEGHRVIGIDNMTSYYDVRMKEKRNELLLSYPSFQFEQIDFGNFDSLFQLINASKPKVIIHLGAQAGVRYSLENPWAYEQSNNLGTLNIFEAAKRSGVQNVLFASSSSVYGANTKTPFSEEDPVTQPISLYAATKRANELLAYTYHHLYGMQTAGFRFFTVYGIYGRPDMALFKFAKNMLLGKEITVYNNGDMKRDFTFVDDIVDGLVRAISAIEKGKIKYEIYNLGGDSPVKLLDFIAELEKTLNCKAKMKFLPLQMGDVQETVADVSKARAQLGFDPKTRIPEGIKIFSEWFLENKDWLLELDDPKQ